MEEREAQDEGVGGKLVKVGGRGGEEGGERREDVQKR